MERSPALHAERQSTSRVRQTDEVPSAQSARVHRRRRLRRQQEAQRRVSEAVASTGYIVYEVPVGSVGGGLHALVPCRICLWRRKHTVGRIQTATQLRPSSWWWLGVADLSWSRIRTAGHFLDAEKGRQTRPHALNKGVVVLPHVLRRKGGLVSARKVASVNTGCKHNTQSYTPVFAGRRLSPGRR